MWKEENKVILSIFIFCLFGFWLNAQDLTQKYSKIKVDIKNRLEVAELAKLGLELEHAKGSFADGIEIVVSEFEMQKLEENRFEYEVLIADMYQDYLRRRSIEQNDPRFQAILNQRSSNAADGFGYGSMGGFYTYTEVVNKMDEMLANFPNLVTQKFSIGTSLEGRTIWAYKISDNPNTDESNEEEVVYYDAMHHAREPMSMSCILNFSFWLLENYASDSEVEYLLDNRELYFVPIVNPDGYVQNQSDFPFGGGLWRKNKRVTSSSCPASFGVDLNRNYADGWGLTVGSSSDPCEETYHGNAAFSEPESQAVRDFTNDIDPVSVMTIHAVDGSVLMPYGYTSPADEHGLYSELCMEMYDENNYLHGLISGVIGYFTAGTTRDYMHSSGRFSILPEIGGSGFWPMQSEIFPLVDENVKPMKMFAWLAGSMADFQSHKLKGQLVPGSSSGLEIAIKNKGLNSSSGNVTVQLLSNNPDVTIINNNISYGNIGSRATENNANDLFGLEIDNNASVGDEVEIEVMVMQDGLETDREVLIFHIGFRQELFKDDSENGSGKWAGNGNPNTWEICDDDAYSGNNCFCDSEGGSIINADNIFRISNGIDLSNTQNPKAEFAAKWSMESSVDFARFQVSTNNGGSWTSLQSDFTISVNGAQAYTGNTNWVHVVSDLSAYTNQSNVRFRFSLSSNATRASDGFYFDDFSIVDYRDCPDISSDKIFVNQNATGSGFGDTWNDAYSNLELAFNVLDCNGSIDTIWIAEGIYKTDAFGDDRSKYFELDKGYKIYGGFSGNETSINQRDIASHPTIISGEIGSGSPSDNANTIFRNIVTNDTVIIDGIIIESGYQDDFTFNLYSGGITNYGKLILSNCIIDNCFSIYDGSSIYTSNPNSYLRFENSTISNSSGNQDRWFYSRNGAVIDFIGVNNIE